MMEWHLGKNASISVVKERHACVHALPFPFPFRLYHPLSKARKRKRKRKVPIFGFDLHHT